MGFSSVSIPLLLLFLHLMSFTCATHISRPNIVIFLTDDQDVLLESLNYMPIVQRYFRDEGVQFTNAYTTTPVCCPARSSLLSGKYQHNLLVYNDTSSGNCAGPYWQQTYEKRSMGPFLQEAGYETFYLGKYLDEYGYSTAGGVSHVPPGWDHWLGLVGNSAYYNYVLSHNGYSEYHGEDYYRDYLPLVLRNRTLDFFRERRADADRADRPFFIFISLPSIHQAAIAAPQHQDEFYGLQAPRTPGWNTQSKDKHWFVSVSGVYGPMDENQIEFSDLMYRRRIQTLQFVDEFVENVVTDLTEAGEIDNTYMFYTSDHGYHLGQNGLALDKRLPYETDIHVPLFVRGPSVPKGKVVSSGVTSVDFLPTLMEIAGITHPYPDQFDGMSFLPLIPSLATSETHPRAFLTEYRGTHNSGGYNSVSACNLNLTGVQCMIEHQMPTPPYASLSFQPFCSCQDSRNNSYQCLRIISAAANWQFCEFSGGEFEFYDIELDEWQVYNQVPTLSHDTIRELSNALSHLSTCRGTGCWINEKRESWFNKIFGSLQK
eukprot:TRINITY_DN16267_c0_g1_i1.p1 TRINITY_DN16267_c0_g1~~TRINITY_DN16267_c0_g1_i1.p1  ORF type:complete len:566 (-),score=47.55 TRINITY_DN16267_c0_g1_i1:35-1666(-)